VKIEGSTIKGRAVTWAVLAPTVLLLLSACKSLPPPDKGDDKTYLVDLTGERWEIHQALSLGFSREKFSYGVGRDFFPPLDDSYLRDEAVSVFPHTRVIGVSKDSEARAYVVPRLRNHEVSNSAIGSESIAVGY